MALHNYHSIKHPCKTNPISHKGLPLKGFSDCIFICTFLPRFQDQAYDFEMLYIKTILITESIPKAEVMGKSQHVWPNMQNHYQMLVSFQLTIPWQETSASLSLPTLTLKTVYIACIPQYQHWLSASSFKNNGFD